MLRVNQINLNRTETQSNHTIFLTSGALPTDAACEIHVLGKDRHTLAVDGTKVGVLKNTDHIGFRCFLKSSDGRRLKPELRPVILSNLTDKALKGEPATIESLTKTDSR